MIAQGFVGQPIDEEKQRDAFCTPRALALAVGEVDYDVCTNERSHIIARRTFNLDRGKDGLKLARYVPRGALVWCNPPYSRGQVIQWVLAYAHTRFIFLLRHDTSTKWYRELYERTRMLAQPWERINFEPPPGIEITDSNPYPHSLFYKDPNTITPAIERMCALLQPVREGVKSLCVSKQ